MDASSNHQPITYAPDVTNYSSGGQYLFFGTGKFIEMGDKSVTAQQTVYGVWDNGAAVSGRSDLNKVSMTTSGGLRTTALCTTTTTPSCTPPTSPKGWYLDLATNGTNPSEFMAGNPYAQYGLVFLNTYTPSINVCDNGTSYRMAVNFSDGSTSSSKIFDTNGNGTVDTSDSLVSGIQVSGTLGGITIVSGANGLGLILGSPIDGGSGPQVSKIKTPVGQSGRITWHEILQ
jgi:type IV pilus assembly protein PilY1